MQCSCARNQKSFILERTVRESAEMFEGLDPRDVSRMDEQTLKFPELCCCETLLSPRMHGTGAFGQQGGAGRYAFLEITC